jgi:hypothetical protein
VPGPLAPNGRTGGEILGQNAIMRFRSGIVNFSKVSFTGGTNVVTGIFDNQGTVFVAGDNTTVTFEDEFINGPGGLLQLEPNISLISFLDSITFSGAGALSTSFGGRPTGQEISHIAAGGDVVLGGLLTASLFTAPGVPGFSPQPFDTFEIIHAGGELIGDFATFIPPPCIGGLCFTGFPDPVLDSYFIQAFAPIPAGGGADFNGDGIVNDIDLAIWRQNLGGPGPAGDANGDGIVDGRDFFVWQDQVGTPGGPPGAGSGGGAGDVGAGTVPEPASIALVTCGALLAQALQRRRRSR